MYVNLSGDNGTRGPFFYWLDNEWTICKIRTVELELGSGHANILIIHHRRSKNINFQRLYCLFRPRKEPYRSRVPPGADGLPRLL